MVARPELATALLKRQQDKRDGIRDPNNQSLVPRRYQRHFNLEREFNLEDLIGEKLRSLQPLPTVPSNDGSAFPAIPDDLIDSLKRFFLPRRR